MRNLVVLKALKWSFVGLETAITLKNITFESSQNTFHVCADLEQAALQVNPESVARPVPCDLGMHPLNAHCILKLYNIYNLHGVSVEVFSI